MANFYEPRNTYYLTLTGPRRGERVVGSVSTDDRFLCEKLFGCGHIDEKGFGFKGLYTEEEVIHMFCPGKEIVGTYNPAIGSHEYHKDYKKAPAFFEENGKIYRLKGDKRLLLDLNVNRNDFAYVNSVLSGKVPAIEDEAPAKKSSMFADEKHLAEEKLSLFDAVDEPLFEDGDDYEKAPFEGSEFDDDSYEPFFEGVDDYQPTEEELKAAMNSKPKDLFKLAFAKSMMQTKEKESYDEEDLDTLVGDDVDELSDWFAKHKG